MSKPRITVKDEVFQVGMEIPIPGSRIHHLKRVLRLQAGDTVEVLSPSSGGSVGQAEIVELQDDRGLVRLVSVDDGITSPTDPPFPLTMVIGFLKGDKMERVVRSCTLLGADRFIPIFTGRSVSRPPEGARLRNRLERLERIAGEAARLCRRSSPPVIEPPVHSLASLAETLTALSPADECAGNPAGDGAPQESGDRAEIRLVAYEGHIEGYQDQDQEQQHPVPINRLLSRLRPSSASAFEGRVIVAVGPEGGFSGAEVALLQGLLFTPVSIGPRILTAEVAAEAVTSIIMNRLGDLG